MSQAVRNRQNRTDKTQRLNETFLGVMVSATAYNGDVRRVECKVPVPSTAGFAASLADGLLPTEATDD